jgi:phosphohistidine phosphatase
MKRLYITRHAKTEPIEFSTDDFHRNLLDRGKNDAHLIAELLAKNNHIPSLLISSPANRAIQTAQIFASIFRIDKDEIILNEKLYHYITTNDLLKILSALDNQLPSVMIFGHNPAFSMLAHNLSKVFDQDLPTSAVVGLDFDCDRWKKIAPRKGLPILFEYPKKYK